MVAVSFHSIAMVQHNIDRIACKQFYQETKDVSWGEKVFL
jgi:hypothetical protein